MYIHKICCTAAVKKNARGHVNGRVAVCECEYECECEVLVAPKSYYSHKFYFLL